MRRLIKLIIEGSLATDFLIQFWYYNSQPASWSLERQNNIDFLQIIYENRAEYIRDRAAWRHYKNSKKLV